MSEKIVIVGLGLIGGSFARALTQNTDHTVLGIDRDEDTLLDALSCGAIHGKAGTDDLRTADWVLLCLYPREALAFAREKGPLLKEGCILLDTCGVKGEVCGGMEALRGSGKYVFIGGHPMAGKEKSGFSVSEAGLFSGASFLMVPGDAPETALDRTEALMKRLGFGRVLRTDARTHDREIAFTSQVPHVLACAYVMSPRAQNHEGFSAGSYRDVSRVANINAELWTRLFLMNREALSQELKELCGNIERFRQAIEQEDEAALRTLLEKAGEIKRTVG